jgi:hypothetical protein
MISSVKLQSFTIPAGLLLLLLHSGSVPIPLVEDPRTPAGKPVRSLVGEQGSGRPMQLGVTTKAEARKQLGTPSFHTIHERAVGYHYVVPCTLWLSPLNLPIGPDFSFFCKPFEPAHYYLFLEFDQAEVLHCFELHRVEGWVSEPGEHADELWQNFLNTVPEKDSAATQPAPRFEGTWFGRPRSSPL